MSKRYIALLYVCWSLIVVGSLLWNIYTMRIDMLAEAKADARASFDKDMVFRQWAEMHGGVV